MARSKNMTVQITVKKIEEDGKNLNITGDRGYLYNVKGSLAGAKGLKTGTTYSVDVAATDVAKLPNKERVQIKKINGPITVDSGKVPTTEGRGKNAA